MKAPVLAIAVPHGGGDDEPDGDEPQADESDERDSFDAYADAAGIPEDKRDNAYEALRSMIESCAAKLKDSKY